MEHQTLLTFRDASEKDYVLLIWALSGNSHHDTKRNDVEYIQPQRTGMVSQNELDYIGKNLKTPFEVKRVQKTFSEVFSEFKNAAENAKTSMDYWRLFFPDKITSLVVECIYLKFDLMGFL